MKHIKSYIEEVSHYIEARDYAGYDPYDALNSRLLSLLGHGGKWARIAFTQINKRSSVNLRPLLGVRKEHNPKGIGLFLWGYSKLYKQTRKSTCLEKIDYLLGLLRELKCKGYSGNCWGYNFDWQSRTFLRPKGTPTIVNTSFIAHALLDCYEFTGRNQALEMATPIAQFILQDLHRTHLDSTFCFSYTPVDDGVVHNANMLGASVLIRLNKYCQDKRLVEAANASLAFSMKHQRQDGSWYYADTPRQRWIDSFHTGFNLQALRYFIKEGYGEQYKKAYEQGVKYYADMFFLEDGTPKYYHDKVYPIDIHAPAQAVVFFSSMGNLYKHLTDRVLNWMLENMYSGKGWFYFQKYKHRTNKISYMRWSQAWAFHALTEYILYYSQGSGYEG